ncbi:hypothetical protein HK097_007636 [Rhizophlyctis rosea]|uniref:HMG box domain-containing protein n=1 Tax=Rhizophlyctis rosea TaxID=64517 RepID=A0AAD5SBF1_9FUNG|nr:hypothetical protein HK097_007636 [Rhizophlyctis rosea]
MLRQPTTCFSFANTASQARAYAVAAGLSTTTKVPSVATIARRQLKALPKLSVQVPKKAGGPYAIFNKEVRATDPSLGKGTSLSAASRVIAERWRGLSPAEKKTYEDRATQQKEAYKRQYEQYLAKRTPQDVILEQKIGYLQSVINPNKPSRKVPAAADAPKKPLSSYLLFSTEAQAAGPERQRQLIGQVLQGAMTQQVKTIAAAWNGLSAEQKSKYQQQAANALSAYKTQKAQYDSTNQIAETRKAVNKTLQTAAKSLQPKPKKKKVLKLSTTGPRRIVKKKKDVAPKKKTVAVKAKKVVKKTAAPKKKVGVKGAAKKAISATKKAGKAIRVVGKVAGKEVVKKVKKVVKA